MFSLASLLGGVGSRPLRIALWRTRIAIESERRRMWLGLLWWVLEPLMAMVVFYVVFRLGLRAGGDGYLQRLAVGLLMWRWYETTLLQAGQSILQSRPEYIDFPIPKAVYPLSSFTLGCAKFFPVFLATVLILFVIGPSEQVMPRILTLILILLVEGVLVLGGCFLFSSLVPFVPDLRESVGFLMRLQFFVSNIVFPIEALPQELLTIVSLNPMAVLISAAQDTILGVQFAPTTSLAFPGTLGVVALVVGLALLRRFSGVYGKIAS